MLNALETPEIIRMRLRNNREKVFILLIILSL